jgi:hypothetical protein
VAQSESILDTAQHIVHSSRQAEYGHPLDNWSLTADLFTAALRDKLKPGEAIDAETAILLMVQVKVARHLHRAHRDSRVDIAGYAEALDMVVNERARRAEE